jgi:uncharacterized protein YbjT (DUF2867 family)
MPSAPPALELGGPGAGADHEQQLVRAMTRNPAKTAASFPSGVEVVRADFADTESLVAAAEGAKAVFMLSAPGPWVIQHDEAILAAARSAGVRKGGDDIEQSVVG